MKSDRYTQGYSLTFILIWFSPLPYMDIDDYTDDLIYEISMENNL